MPPAVARGPRGHGQSVEANCLRWVALAPALGGACASAANEDSASKETAGTAQQRSLGEIKTDLSIEVEKLTKRI